MSYKRENLSPNDTLIILGFMYICMLLISCKQHLLKDTALDNLQIIPLCIVDDVNEIAILSLYKHLNFISAVKRNKTIVRGCHHTGCHEGISCISSTMPILSC